MKKYSKTRIVNTRKIEAETYFKGQQNFEHKSVAIEESIYSPEWSHTLCEIANAVEMKDRTMTNTLLESKSKLKPQHL